MCIYQFLTTLSQIVCSLPLALLSCSSLCKITCMSREENTRWLSQQKTRFYILLLLIEVSCPSHSPLPSHYPYRLKAIAMAMRINEI